VKALTLKMADRDEMTKKLRLNNNYIKNMYELMKFSFLDESKDPMNGTLKAEITKELQYNVPLNDIVARIHQYCIQNAIHYD
jgi:hypothetical protein